MLRGAVFYDTMNQTMCLKMQRVFLYYRIWRRYVMGHEPIIKLYALTVDCKDPHALAAFYAALLGWEIPYYDEEYACLAAPGTACLLYTSRPRCRAACRKARIPNCSPGPARPKRVLRAA